MRLLPGLAASCFLVASALADLPPCHRAVMTWVPPYGVAKARARLAESFAGVPMTDGLTHLALQFWAPAKDGGVERVKKYGELSDATVSEFRKLANDRGVRAMLCVYNGVEKWDWALARAAFAEHREEFAAALVGEAKRLDLDGIDIDLEGNGELDGDKPVFVAFIATLSRRARAAGLELTVDSFAYVWNAPNQSWWSDLLPHVDRLNSMGYEETGAGAKGWRAFAAQKAAAGEHAAKLLIGVPTEKAEWQGGKALTHLRWLREHETGAALWDAQLDSPAWRSREVWSVLREIRAPR